MGIFSYTALDKLLRIERPVEDSALDGAGSGSWEPVGTARAQVQDELPSRSERLSGGASMTTRRARVRMRFRTDVKSNMRFVIGDRVMQITSGPAEIGRREGLECMVEDYSPAGNPA
jgi:head-tail adaptor